MAAVCDQTPTILQYAARVTVLVALAHLPDPVAAQEAGSVRCCDPPASPSENSSVPPVTHRVNLEGIEVVQSIQDISHSVPLLENRRTLVRVYLSATTETGCGVLEGEITVTPLGGGDEVKIRSVQPVHVWDDWNGNWKTFKRQHLHTSLNFELPSECVVVGEYLVTVSEVKDRVTNAPVPCDDLVGVCRCYTVVEAAPLRLQVLGLTYSMNGSVHSPRPVDYQSIESWLDRAYPVREVRYGARSIPWPYEVPFRAGEANAFVTMVRILDIAGGADARTHYYGLVYDGGFYFGGAGTRPSSPDPAASASGPAGQPSPTRHSWDQDSSYADSYAAHELGHTLGQRHVGGVCSENGVDSDYPFFAGKLSGEDPETAFVGLDFGDVELGIARGALDGRQWHDTMSYCPFRWVSSYTYQRVHQQLLAEDQLSPSTTFRIGVADRGRRIQPEDSVRLVTGTPMVVVIGIIDPDKSSGRINSVLPVNRTTVGRAGTRVRFIVHFANGNQLEVPAAEYRQSDERIVVAGVFPASADARQIDLLLGDAVVDSRRASAEPPKFVDGALQDVYSNGGSGTVRWEANDPDGDMIRYSVQIEGKDAIWRTIVADSPTASIDLAALDLDADQQHVRVRILASDGFHTAELIERLVVVPVR